MFNYLYLTLLGVSFLWMLNFQISATIITSSHLCLQSQIMMLEYMSFDFIFNILKDFSIVVNRHYLLKFNQGSKRNKDSVYSL